MGLQGMNNNHPQNHQLSLYDVMIQFTLKAPDKKKATGALLILIGREDMEALLNYKNTFTSYQAWRNHLASALDNAQAKIDATKPKP